MQHVLCQLQNGWFFFQLISFLSFSLFLPLCSFMVPDISGSILPVFHQEASCIFYFPTTSKTVSDLSLLSSSNPMRMQSCPPLHGVLCLFSHFQFLLFFSLHPSQMTSWVASACIVYWSASSVNTEKSLLVIILPPDLSCNKPNSREF